MTVLGIKGEARELDNIEFIPGREYDVTFSGPGGRLTSYSKLLYNGRRTETVELEGAPSIVVDWFWWDRDDTGVHEYPVVMLPSQVVEARLAESG